MAYRLSRAAEDQLEAVLLESVRVHGLEASDRYNALLLAAISAVGSNPRLLGSSDVPRVPGIRAYPARLSRARYYAASRVRAPRHVIIYRVSADDVIEVLGVVHDRMVLPRAARKAIRDAENT